MRRCLRRRVGAERRGRWCRDAPLSRASGLRGYRRRAPPATTWPNPSGGCPGAVPAGKQPISAGVVPCDGSSATHLTGTLDQRASSLQLASTEPGRASRQRSLDAGQRAIDATFEAPHASRIRGLQCRDGCATASPKKPTASPKKPTASPKKPFAPPRCVRPHLAARSRAPPRPRPRPRPRRRPSRMADPAVAASTATAPVPPTVLKLLLPRLTLRQTAAVAMVCRAWRAAAEEQLSLSLTLDVCALQGHAPLGRAVLQARRPRAAGRRWARARGARGRGARARGAAAARAHAASGLRGDSAAMGSHRRRAAGARAAAPHARAAAPRPGQRCGPVHCLARCAAAAAPRRCAAVPRRFALPAHCSERTRRPARTQAAS
jgi:hypothetical protein